MTSAVDLPALLGGSPAFPNGPPAWPTPDPLVAQAIAAAVADGTWGLYHGPHTDALTEVLRAAFHVDHVLLTGSGSYAVELGLRALGVGPGDEVILASYDYPGNFLAIHAVGAVPMFVDILPHNWNLSVQQVVGAIGPRTRAVLASHLHGGVVDMPQLMTLARERNVFVLEDAAQCPGAALHGKPAGAWGDAGVLSFGGSKLLTAGRGGALLTHRADVAQRARTHWLRAGNIVCPLSQLQAAALLPQVHQLAARHAARHDRVQRLAERMQAIPGIRMFTNQRADLSPGYYKVGFQYEAASFGLTRERLVAALRAEGVALSEGFAAQHVGRSPKRFRAAGSLGESERAHEACVVLHHPILLGSDDDIDGVARAFAKVQAHAAALANIDLSAYPGSKDPAP